MPAGDWQFLWATNAGPVLGEIPTVKERKVSFKLNQPGTVELTVPLSSEVGQLIAMSADSWGHILVYHKGTLRMVTELTSMELQPKPVTGNEVSTIALVASESAYVRLDASVASASPKPFPFPDAAGQAGSKLLTLIGGAGGNGISSGTAGTTASIAPSTFEAGMSQLQLLQAFAFRGSGFDFWFDPIYTPGGVFGFGSLAKVGKLNIKALRGSAKPNAAFGYGEATRANLETYSFKALAGDQLCNFAWVPPSGTSGDKASGVKVSSVNDSRLIFGNRMRWITADFDDPGLRQQLADIHVTYRSYPRRILSFTPTADDGSGYVPQPFVDYDVGDIVPANIQDEGLQIANADVRIYGFSATIDVNGQEKVELETTQETAS